MLSDHNVRQINSQISRELRTVESYSPSDEEKESAIKRIASLKELLENPETPSRKNILKELATALIEAREETRQSHKPVDFWEAVFGIRR